MASNTPPFADYPHVTIRTPGADFFRSPLEDSERRRFLFECPKNTLRQYQPPEPMRIGTSTTAKAHDQQLFDIRLSGLVSTPFDDQDTMRQHSLVFGQAIHAHLADIATYITANLYKATNIHGKPPSFTTKPNPLIDAKTFVEHLTLDSSVHKAIQPQRPRSRPPQQQQPSKKSSPSATAPPRPQSSNQAPFDKGYQKTSNTTGSSDFRASCSSSFASAKLF
ncbi:unnamed protein product [Absidia cylindrospora]